MKRGHVERAVELLAQSGIAPTIKDGKIYYETNFKPGGPWVYLRYSKHNCTMLKTFLFELISRRLPKDQQFIPCECLDCYKVVARPESLDDLMELKSIMEKMDYPSKCGIEKRDSVDALYGGYWYCGNYKEGLERLDQVRKALSGTKIPFFLKRGCTEYESFFGPSDKWEIVHGQQDIEKDVFERVVIDNTKYPQSEKAIEKIISHWKEWAEQLGPIYKGSHNYVTYGGGNNGESRSIEETETGV